MPDNATHPNAQIREAWRRGLEVLKPTGDQLERGLRLHAEALSCDCFAFMPSTFPPETVEEWNALKQGWEGERALRWKMSLRRETSATRSADAAGEFTGALEAAGLSCMVQTVAEGKSREEDIKRMSTSAKLIRTFRRHLSQAGSAAQVREIAKQGRTAVVWSANGPPLAGKLTDLEEELSYLETWQNLGVRLMHLTYNRRNLIGDGGAEASDAGLSDLGRELIARLNQLGIIIDTPHTGRRTTLEAAELSEKPIMASHSGSRTLRGHFRFKTRSEIEAIAEHGGVVGVLGLPQLLGRGATLATMLDHVVAIADMVGPAHVAIGTDNNYQTPFPDGVSGYDQPRYSTRWWGAWNASTLPAGHFSDESYAGSLAWTNWPLYTVGLVTRGFSNEEVAGILCGNFLRVLEANQPGDLEPDPPEQGTSV